MNARAAMALSVLSCGMGACQPDFNVPVPSAPVDAAYFRCHVQPVLTKNCSMFACHGADGNNGTGARYFRLYARSRLRPVGVPEAMRNSTFTAAEYTANFVAAADLIDTGSRDDSLLLLKPLEQSAGGYFHRGADLYGQGNVFLTRDDPDFVVLSAWAHGATEVPQCIEPGSNL
jgi:hypothetical protein